MKCSHERGRGRGLPVALAALLALGAAPSANALPAETCDLETCVSLALGRAPGVKAAEARGDAAPAGAGGVKAAEARVDAATSMRRATKSQYGPRLSVDGGVQVWDSALVANFGGLPAIPGLPEMSGFRIRDQVTWNVNLTIAQPLMGLWTVFEASELQRLGVDAAALEAEGESRRLALETVEAWLQAALADKLIAVAEASVLARENDRDRARVLADGGVLLEAELMRAELGLQQARQQLAQAKRQERLSVARLSQLVGRPMQPATSELRIVDRPPIESLEDARRAAVSRRTELQALEAQLGQARRAIDVEVTQLMPSVNLVAQAQFVGGSELQAREQAFVGVSFDWVFWEWGSRYHKMDELRARVREVELRMQQVTEGLELEVESAWIAWASAVEQAELAAQAEAVAERNYTLSRARFDAGALTSFELNEAESALTRSRIEERVATASALIARAQLRRAMGGTQDEIVKEATP